MSRVRDRSKERAEARALARHINTMPIAVVQDPNATVRAEIVVIGEKIMEAQVRQKARIEELEAALRPFADMATAVDENMPAKDDRWALIRVRDKAITHADLKRARDVMNGGSE